MPRFSLKTLLIVAAVIPLALYGLAKASPLVAAFVMTLTVFGWIAAILLWLGGDSELREVARGYAVSALTYSIAAFVLGPSSFFGNQLLITTHLLSFVREQIVVETPLPPPYVGVDDFPDWTQFHFVGQSYLCVIVGLIGGWFAGWLYRRRQRARSQH